MKNTNTLKLNRIRLQRDNQLNSLDDNFNNYIASLEQKYNISQHFYNSDAKDWSESETTFNYEANRQFKIHKCRTHDILIEWFIKFLITTNIAHRGHLLHSDTMLQKIKKYGSDGEYAIDIYDNIGHHDIIQKKLAPYGITFMTKNLYDKVYDEYMYGYVSESRQKHLENFLKLFHTSMGRYKQHQKGYKVPTKRHQFRLLQEQIQRRLCDNEMPF